MNPVGSAGIGWKERNIVALPDRLEAVQHLGSEPRLILRLPIDKVFLGQRIILDDTQVLSVIEKLLKQRRESIVQFEKGARPDLVAIEQAEVVVLLAYLPAQMSEAEIETIVVEAITQTGAKGPADMGKLMAVLTPKLAGRADMGRVSGLVKARLTG